MRLAIFRSRGRDRPNPGVEVNLTPPGAPGFISPYCGQNDELKRAAAGAIALAQLNKERRHVSNGHRGVMLFDGLVFPQRDVDDGARERVITTEQPPGLGVLNNLRELEANALGAH